MDTKFEAIWEEFGGPLKSFIQKRMRNPQDAEDVLQEVLANVARGMNGLKDDDRICAWIFRVARNAIIDHYRKNRAGAAQTELSEELPDELEDDISASGEIALCLRAMVEQLPEKYRQAIILTEFQNLTQKELSQVAGLTLSGAKSRVQRARAMLKETLLGCCHLEFDRLGNIIEYSHRKQHYRFC